MTKDNPKLTNVERRRLHYRKLYGLDKPESSGDLKTDIKRYINEADAEKKKVVTPPKVDVDSITKSRMFLEKVRGEKVEFKQLKFDFDKEQQ